MLLPEDILLLIRAYGLADGIQKNAKELAKMYGVYPSTIYNRLVNIRTKLRSNPALREAVLANPFV